MYDPGALVLRVRELPTRASRVRAARSRLSVRERQNWRGLLGNQKRTHMLHAGERGGVRNPAFQDIYRELFAIELCDLRFHHVKPIRQF